MIRQWIAAAALAAGACVLAAHAAQPIDPATYIKMPPTQEIFTSKLYEVGRPLKEKPLAMTDFREFRWAHKMPDLSFEDLQGKTHKFSDYRGKMVILNVWATWCEPCSREMPNLVAMANKFQGKDSPIQFMMVSINDKAPAVTKFAEKISAKMKENELEGKSELWIDPAKNILNTLPSDVVPSAFFLDGKGNFVAFIRGFVEWADPEMEDFLKRLAEKYAHK